MDPKSGGQKWTPKVAVKSGPQKWRSKKDPKSGGQKSTPKVAAKSGFQKWHNLSKIVSVLLSASVASVAHEWSPKVKSGPQKWRSKKDPKSGGQKWTPKVAVKKGPQKWTPKW